MKVVHVSIVGAILALAALVFTVPARAEESAGTPPYRVTVGFGQTYPVMTGSDNLRTAQHRPLKDGSGNPIQDDGTIDAPKGFEARNGVFEYYFRPSMAFGFQWLYQHSERQLALGDAMIFGAAAPAVQYIERVYLNQSFVTFTWLPWRYDRWQTGVLGGIGSTTYSYTQTVTGKESLADSFENFFSFGFGGGSPEIYSHDSEVSALSEQAGGFIEYGGDSVALRLGANYIQAPLPDLNAPQPPAGASRSFHVSGTGMAYYLNLMFRFGQTASSETQKADRTKPSPEALPELANPSPAVPSAPASAGSTAPPGPAAEVK